MKCELALLISSKLSFSLSIMMITLSPRILFLFTSVIIVFICLATSASGATCLPSDEVEALKQIGKSLGKDWNFSGDVDPCSGEAGGWISKDPNIYQYENIVNCSYVNSTVCHIDSISLKSQSLPGTFPPELARLPGLHMIDLTRNYLNGTIPLEWGSMQNLTVISIQGNRLTGSIPKELGNISTLEEIVLEFNQLSGTIPPEIGNLSRLRRLFFTSNNFSGELPKTLAQLTNLRDFRIGDNKFIGSIPNFIGSWLNLERLIIQASGLDGPIPPSIAVLKNLTDLRISDLNGTQQTFPPLRSLTKLETLILRSCNISGHLPDYLGAMTSLKNLDLSFNKLSGTIPNNFVSRTMIKYIYLTGNLLNGPMPGWMSDSTKSIDLSYNNFNVNSSTCDQDRNAEIVSCLRSLGCPQNLYNFFHINCGGKEATVDGKTYEEDTDSRGASSFFKSKTNWAFSNTGDFSLDALSGNAPLIENNISRLSMENSDLYEQARVSPISLTYYGFCLAKGNYTVSLQFAEIMFTDNKNFSSLGRRVFDIYIQGKLERKDFDIEDKAGGVGKKFIDNFTAVVNDSTLEIRFYWAGKGTTSIPRKGVYGPLISAISVMNPDFVPPESKKNLPMGVVVGIVAAAVVFIILLLGIFWWRGCLRRKDTMEQDMMGLDLQTGSFTLRQIKSATQNFNAANKIGEGGFGSVYKGLLSDGTIIAVKQLSSKSKQGNREFLNEVGMISALQHPHLVKLYGCCIEGNQLLLVYEYMENNSLARALFGPEECQLKLDWPTRYKICIGIARGLAYLHEESRLKIVHRDIKATNVLLDKNLNPKISDFGLAKLDEEDDTHISTRIAGTYGYMAPEYAMHGYLTDKADVYSFGIVALEIVSGRSNNSHKRKEDCLHLLDWALALEKKGNLMELVDPRLGPDFNKDEVMVMIRVALLCASASSIVRPTMSSVVSMLVGRTFTEGLVSDPTGFSDEFNLKGKMTGQEIDAIQATSTEMPLSASSMSAGDLYPLISDSDYWANRL